jgi:site-specific DNA recombinase
MESKKIVGIWIRVSTEDQAKGESPEHHEKRARLYAEAKGWTVREVYHLEAVSGKSVMEHAETKKMLQDVKEGHVTGLIFSKLARLARNTRELLDFADFFRKYDADLISLQESIDTSSPAGRLFYTMIAAMAQWEREEISERVAVSVPIRARLGKPLGGQASFGYRWDGKQLVIEEKEAPIRKLIYELFLKHKRKKSTADELNKMGYRTRNGSMFSDTTVDRLLRDPSAKGERRANYTKSLGEGKNWVLKPESDWIVSECPAIVSEDTWNECNRILSEQEKKRNRPGPRPVYLLSGFINCTCGKKMYVFHSSLVYTCKACKNRIAVADIDEIYHDQLKTFLLTDSDISNYVKQSDSRIKEKENLLILMTEEANVIRKKMDEIVNMRLTGEMPRESFPRHYMPLEERYKQIENQLPELQAEVDFLKIQYLSSDTVIREAKDLYDRWPNLPFEEKRTIIEVITEKITIGKDDISFSLSYLPSSFQKTGKSPHNFKGSWKPPT